MHRSLSLLAGLLAAQAGLALAQDTPTPAAREAARRSNAFGNDLYRRLAADEGGNLIFSPSSISAAMGMSSPAEARDRLLLVGIMQAQQEWAGAKEQCEMALARRGVLNAQQATMFETFLRQSETMLGSSKTE